MSQQIDLEIVALDPQPGGLMLVEAQGTGGVRMMIALPLAQSPEVGSHMTLVLGAQPAAAAPSMRERMQARLGTSASAGSQAPRAAVSTPRAPSPAASDASSLLLTSILGGSSRSSDTEHNVDAEMDALFGAPRKG